MSRAVLNSVLVPKPHRDSIVLHLIGPNGVARAGIVANLLQQIHQHRIAAGFDLLAQTLDQVPAPLRQIDDPRRQAGGMQE
jgi:hypothetical protein